MYRYFIEMAYNGTQYHGWQIQENAISVQSLVEDAASRLLKNSVNVVGAGRTDTGVHASYFTAHFDLEEPIVDTDFFVFKINRILPRDIVVFTIQLVDNQLHSRFSALSRTYNYFLTLHENPFKNHISFRSVYPLDFNLMNQASARLLHHSDFTSFSKLHTDVKTNNCKVEYAEWIQLAHNEWCYVIRADRFLRNMVRAIVGTLLDVGRKKISVDDFDRIIATKDRGAASSSAAPQALFLTDIVYPQGMGFTPMPYDSRLKTF